MLVAIIILKFYYNETVIKIGGVGILVVLSSSMEPAILKDELVVIKEQNAYEKGDIITYEDKLGNLITHRIIENHQDKVITRGDSNFSVDDIVEKSSIEGKVIFHSKILGYFVLSILKPLIIIIFLAYLLKAIIYFVFVKIILKICKSC